MRTRVLGGARAWGSEGALPGVSDSVLGKSPFSEPHGHRLHVFLEHARHITDRLMTLNVHLIRYQIIYII